MHRGWLVLVIIGTTASADAGRGGGIVIPPAMVDVGSSVAIGREASVGPSIDILAGIHWASLYWKPTSIDVGFGFVGSYRDVVAAGSYRDVTSGSAIARPARPPDNRLSLSGVYADVAYAIENHRHWRTWIGARVESLRGSVDGRSFGAFGGAARISTEVFVSGAKVRSRRNSFGVVSGALAIGVYVEAVRRDLPPELGPVSVAAGLTMRVPFIAAVVD